MNVGVKEKNGKENGNYQGLSTTTVKACSPHGVAGFQKGSEQR